MRIAAFCAAAAIDGMYQIRTIERNKEIPHEGAFCDMMWSDPEEIRDAWLISPRGAGYLFGSRVAEEFNHMNGLDLICRAHQVCVAVVEVSCRVVVFWVCCARIIAFAVWL